MTTMSAQNQKKRIFFFCFVIIVLVIITTLYISNALGIGKSQADPATSSLSTPLRHDKNQLLLMTKGRSGSSFISAIINKHQSVFYTFEPLAFLDDVENKNIHRERIYSTLKLYLLCDFMGINAYDMNSTFHVSTVHGKKFVKCERKLTDGFTHIQCFLKYVKSCRTHDLTFSKVIRLPMEFAQDLLQMMPQLKIIYLIRDPRAVLYSQVKHLKNIKFVWGNEIKPNAESHCEELKNDFDEIRKLEPLFPGRIRVIRYENLASNTMGYAKEIYDFAGLDFSDETRDYISYLQSPDETDDKRAYGLRRSNTSQVMNKWRLVRGSYEAAQLIDKFCGKLYPALGYRKVKSYDQLVSLVKPLHRKRFQIS